MLRVTKATDYGIVLLSYMAHRARRSTAEMHNAPDLARATGLPLPMVSKILKALGRAGVVISHRGTKGGYSLADPPERISVARVIEALEGPVTITECTDRSTSRCSVERLCPVRPSWARINQAIRGALEGIMLSEMLTPVDFSRRIEDAGRGGELPDEAVMEPAG